jgi:hypothetical protein
MTAVNYEDFCNMWRLFDVGDDPSLYGCQVNACFTIYCKGGKYYYAAGRGFKGNMNDTDVELRTDGGAHGEYGKGASLSGGLVGDFGSKGTITFSLNEMGPDAFLISLSKAQAAGATAQNHGGAHGIPD